MLRKQNGTLLITLLLAAPTQVFSLSTHEQVKEPISPIPLSIEIDTRKAELGKKLFHDARLSANNTISCASCHPLDNAGMDGRRVSVGINGKLGSINAPTVFNSVFNHSQHWDGRAKNLQEQIENPVTHPNEMASNWESIVIKLEMDEAYKSQFRFIYTDGITETNIKNAIATFEMSLITPGSRFDKFLRGDTEVLTSEEIEGYRLFKANGCSSCHQGVNVGGNMYAKMGVFGRYFEDRGDITKEDYGRYNVTNIEKDRNVFKVPSLRNVALTAPYFHDGSARTLREAVLDMATYQLGYDMPLHEANKIVAFLMTLTGDFGDYRDGDD